VRREEAGVWRRIPYTAEEAIANSVAVIEAWHGAGGGRVRVQLAPPYLFGRHVAHGRLMGHPLPTPADAPRMLAHAREMRALADRYGVALHTHFFRGSVAFARRHFGDDEAQRLFGRDTVVAHANGLAPDEVEWLGARRAAIATVAHTHENLWYGTSPIVALLEAGANVTIATDGAAPYSGYDLLREPSRATWHQWTEHRSQSVLPPGKALRMITIDAAHALGVGDEVGSLEPGKAADLITIDLQQAHLTPATALPHLLVQYATGRDVTNVIASGELLLMNGVHQKIDLDEVLARARHEAGLAYGRFDVRPYRALGRDVWRGARYGGK
jgi:5-methylthioadenosine/S-adenosylhomocysteine deaminase